MTRSLRALMQNVIDYAGLFPPAQLSLDQAIHNYARYRNAPESWMLGRFICPAARLAELSPYVDELFKEGPPLAVSALGRGRDEAEFLDGLKLDFSDVSSFRARHGSSVTVDVFETKLPPEPGASNPIIVPAARQVLDADAHPGLNVFYEQPVLCALQDIAHFDRRAGHKLRCGGLDPAAFPQALVLAAEIYSAQRCGVPLKFTAGLHHPIRHHDAGIDTMMHGFLNVFVAGVLATARGLDAKEVLEIIQDEDAGNFIFTDDGLRWRDHQASIAEIELARRSAVISFGSCSFDEPHDDLRALGLM